MDDRSPLASAPRLLARGPPAALLAAHRAGPPGGWIRRFVLFHGTRHPDAMGGAEIAAFLSHLAVARPVAASTQNQALAALLFL